MQTLSIVLGAMRKIQILGSYLQEILFITEFRHALKRRTVATALHILTHLTCEISRIKPILQMREVKKRDVNDRTCLNPESTHINMNPCYEMKYWVVVLF